MNNLTQFAVRCNKMAFLILKNKGYKNVQNLSTDNYTFPAIIEDLKDKIFFGTNTTCMAAMRPKVYDITEIIDIL